MHDQQTLRAMLRRLLGVPTSRGHLSPERRGELDLGDVVVEKWLFTSEPGSRIPASLYRPARVTGRLPAIVMTCGHGGSKSVPHVTYAAQTYAKAGVACLLADPLGEEERHATGGIGTRAHDAPDVAYRCELAGRSVMGKFVFDAMRGLDFLETLDWVDPDRLGVAGNSLGGAAAGWLFALEPRLRMAIVSGWAFSDVLCVSGKFCTRAPFRKLRAVCDWPAFLALGAERCPVLVLNGAADVIIDQAGDGRVWSDTATHLRTVDPSARRLWMEMIPGGGHRPYHASKQAMRFISEQLGPIGVTADALERMPELNYGRWCDEHGVELEPLYGVELHYRGATLLDLGLKPIPRQDLSVLTPAELGGDDFTIDGWLSAAERKD